MASVPTDVAIRQARPADRTGIETVLDLAMLSYPPLEDPMAAGDVFLAEAGDDPATSPVLGVLVGTRPVVTTWRIDAIAVRPNRRGQGIGTALVETAIGRATAVGAETVIARFDADVAPFYRALEFDIAVDPDASVTDRRVGRLEIPSGT